MITLPNEFTERMKSDLGPDFDAFLESLNEEKMTALRFNPLKAGNISVSDGNETDENPARSLPGIDLKGCVDWNPLNGFYYDETDRPGIHPYHHAGVIYIQDASAQGPVELLNPKPYEKVLDLCAAPGGKSTQIAGHLMGTGLLVSNEPMKNRARILSENIERLGVKNAVVVSEYPDKLAEKWPGFFDAIMVDAPCSGEGMFRKNPEAITEWSLENVNMCRERQLDILESAVDMLSAEGRICYSTCTFARAEDEELIATFLERHPDFKLIKEKRFWPHIDKCEGHYMALVARAESKVRLTSYFGGNHDEGMSIPVSDKETKPVMIQKEVSEQTQEKATAEVQKKTPDKVLEKVPVKLPDYLKDILSDYCKIDFSNVIKIGDVYFALPKGIPDTKGIHVLRAGLCLGEETKGRFTPSHALALAIKPLEALRCINISLADENGKKQATDYLKGMTLMTSVDSDFDSNEKGWTLIAVDGYSIGWSKVSGGVAKNHYPKGLRMM